MTKEESECDFRKCDLSIGKIRPSIHSSGQAKDKLFEDNSTQTLMKRYFFKICTINDDEENKEDHDIILSYDDDSEASDSVEDEDDIKPHSIHVKLVCEDSYINPSSARQSYTVFFAWKNERKW